MKKKEPPSGNDGLDTRARQEARRRMSPTAAVVYEAIRREGAMELERDMSALVWSALGAGLSLGFSFLTVGLLNHYLPDAQWTPLLSKLGYSTGFLIVVLGRQQLFTENTLTAILPLLSSWRLGTLLKVARLWIAVLAANLVGAFFFAVLLSWTGFFEVDIRPELLTLAEEKFHPGFPEAFFGSIFAGWLIALMVWLMPFAETGRIIIIVIMTYLIGIGNFGHVIAGSVDAIYHVLQTPGTAWDFCIRFFLPTLLGNIAGGVGFVAILNHAQVSPERA